MFFKHGNYFLREAWTGFRRGGLMTLLAVGTIAVSLFILGIFLILFINLSNVLSSLNSKLDIVVYVDPKIQAVALENINQQLATIPGVKKLEFVSREAAWERFKESFSSLNLDGVMEENPLPDAFKVEVIDLSYIHAVVKKIKNIQGVEDVRYGGDIAEKIETFTKVINISGILLVFFMSLATFTIVVNTIRLTVLARANEIKIMSLVGATKSFIRYPFIMEGILIGLTGAVVSALVLKFGYHMAVSRIESAIPFIPVNLNSTEINLVYFSIFVAGIFLGQFGGYVSANRTFNRELKE